MDPSIDPVEQPAEEPADQPAASVRAERSADVVAFPTNARRGSTITAEPRLREVIGDVLRDERLDQERTLADVADAAAVSLPYLSEVERGRKEVSSDLLAAICDALQVPLADIVQRTADRLRPGGANVVMLAA